MQVKGHGAKLPIKQDEAIVALLASPSIEAAAQKVGIAPSTLFRWMQDDEFKVTYRKAKSAYVYQAITLLQQATTEAVSTLRAIMLDESKPASTRVASAKTILDTAIKAVEFEDLVVRIEKIEKAIIIYSGKS